MITFPKKELDKLKKPLGKLSQTMERIKKLSHERRIIAVGDICTLALLAVGIRPHLAVFDYHYMRRRLDSMFVSALKNNFKDIRTYENQAGTISKRLLHDAKRLVVDGGAVFVDGEEDLTALAFILVARKKDIIVYGQPKKGMVIVEPNEKLKKKIEKILAMALGSKEKSHKRS
jgi:uncharacterized protein (UPF0218 family)